MFPALLYWKAQSIPTHQDGFEKKTANLSWLALNSSHSVRVHCFIFLVEILLRLMFKNLEMTQEVLGKLKLVRTSAVTQLHLPLSTSSIIASRVSVRP